ncbi:MAG: hypothetical protein PVH41_06065 [Anaerolineae bacterium]|jgi:hypothetical protein
MTRTKRAIPIVAAVVVLLMAAACGPSGGETAPPTATPAAPGQSPGTCGDGVCDEAEQSNSSLCPQDCEAAGAAGKCGDGVCDEAERSDPALCPADCAAAIQASGESEAEPQGESQAEPLGEAESQGEPEAEAEGEAEGEGEGEAEGEGEGEPEGEGEGETEGEGEGETEEGSQSQCEPQQWTIAIEGRSSLVRAEPSADLFVAIVGGFNVNESCRIRGTSSGKYMNCGYESPTQLCSYFVDCPKFNAAISGWAVPGEGVTQTLKIQLDRVDIFEKGWADCQGEIAEFERGSVFQDAVGSAERNGGGYLAEIVVPAEGEPDSRRFTSPEQDVDAVVPMNLSYIFHVHLFRGTQSIQFDALWSDWRELHGEWDPMGGS